jgi:hypothetical protein
MSTAHAIMTALEILIVIGVLVAVFYEPVIAKWEQKQKEKILKAFKERKKYRK